MNKIKLIYTLVLLIAISSCRDFVEPAIPYTDFERGTYLRTITPPSTINFFNLTTSSFTILVESVDENDGSSVESVAVFVARRRANAVTTEQPVLTVPKTAFTKTDDSKYIRATITVSIPDALAAMSMTTADINGGDFFEFRLALTDNEGLVFTNTNVSGDVAGGNFYASPFFYRVAVVCPSDLGGTFSYSASNMNSAFGSCPGTITGSVTLTPVSAGSTSYIVSDATFGFWNCYGDNFTGTGVRLNDACGGLSFSGTDKYGDTYAFTFISNDGTNLVFSWRNASNETGTVSLASNPGKPWPAGLR